MFYQGLIIGLCIGCWIGGFLMALCSAASKKPIPKQED